MSTTWTPKLDKQQITEWTKRPHVIQVHFKQTTEENNQPVLRPMVDRPGRIVIEFLRAYLIEPKQLAPLNPLQGIMIPGLTAAQRRTVRDLTPLEKANLSYLLSDYT